MAGRARFAKSPLGVRPRKHALRRLDVHALDHLVAEALSAAVEGFDQRSCALDFVSAGTEGVDGMGRFDLDG